MANSRDVVGSIGMREDGADVFASTGYLEQVLHAVEISSEIPPDAKMAVKDFVKERFNALVENLDQLIDFPVPQEIVEYWPVIVEIFKNIFL